MPSLHDKDVLQGGPADGDSLDFVAVPMHEIADQVLSSGGLNVQHAAKYLWTDPQLLFQARGERLRISRGDLQDLIADFTL